MGEIYKIKKNDNLSKIAKQYGTTVEKLAHDNNINNPNLIYEGEELIIDIDTSVEEAANNSQSSTVPTETTPAETTSDDNLEPAPQEEMVLEPPESAQDTPTATIPNPQSTLGRYTGLLYSKKKASPDIKQTNGVLRYGNKIYKIDGNVTQGNTLSQNDYYYFVGQVAGEAANNEDDMLGVAGTILNRLEQGGGSIEAVLKKGYWPWGKTCNKYINYDANGNPIGFKSREQIGDIEFAKLQKVLAVTTDALNGIRNIDPSVKYYYGDGTRNYFSDIV